MKIFITGIGGFVGWHLTSYLISKGDQIAGIDSTDANLAYMIRKRSDLKFYKGNMLDSELLLRALNEFKPDYLIHLAAQSSVKASFENPIETFNNNVMGTLLLLETVRKLDLPSKILLISSSEVYGQVRTSECPVSEEHHLAPVSPYAVGKASIDLLGYQYYKAFDLPIYIARSFSHAGPRQSQIAVLSDWALQIAKIQLALAPPIISVGNLDVKRDYTDVRDIVRAYVGIIEKGQPGKPYNVCCGIGYELAELLKRYCQLSEKDIEIRIDKAKIRPIDIPVLIGSNKRIKEDTNWSPNIPIEKTLLDSFNHWLDELTRLTPRNKSNRR